MCIIKNLKGPFKSREHIQRKEHGPYFEVSTTQALSVTMTIPGDKSQRKVHVYCNFLSLIRKSVQWLISIEKGPKD